MRRWPRRKRSWDTLSVKSRRNTLGGVEANEKRQGPGGSTRGWAFAPSKQTGPPIQRDPYINGGTWPLSMCRLTLFDRKCDLRRGADIRPVSYRGLFPIPKKLWIRVKKSDGSADVAKLSRSRASARPRYRSANTAHIWSKTPGRL